jgi:hypothetical protein
MSDEDAARPGSLRRARSTDAFEPAAPRGLWDESDDDEDGGLWSILRLVDEAESPVDAPGSGAWEARAEDWLRAEASLGRALADAAAAFARLDERLRALGCRAPAAVERLAQAAALDLLRREGAFVAPDRLSLWLAERAATGEAGPDLARAGWAARRLAGGAGALLGPASLRRFLGLSASADPADAERAAREAALADWAARVRALHGAHRLTQAAYARGAWSAMGLSRAGAALEAGVAASALAARMGRGGAPFAPLGRPVAAEGGDAGTRLAVFLAEIEAGADAALAIVERLVEWEERARAGVADLSGRTPGRLVDAVSRRFAISANAAAALCDVSVSAAARNLSLLEERGLLREMTGRGRFRLWSARL